MLSITIPSTSQRVQTSETIQGCSSALCHEFHSQFQWTSPANSPHSAA